MIVPFLAEAILLGSTCYTTIPSPVFDQWVCLERVGPAADWPTWQGTFSEMAALCPTKQNHLLWTGVQTTFLPSTCPTYTVELSWTAPSQNNQCQPLSGLEGYRIYQDDLLLAEVPMGTTSIQLGGLTSGAYVFHITAYTNTEESDILQSAARILP